MKTICDILGPFPTNQMNHNVPSEKKKEKKKNHNANLLNFGYLDLANVRLFVNEHSLRGKLFILIFSCQKNVLQTLQRKRYSLWHFQFFGLATF